MDIKDMKIEAANRRNDGMPNRGAKGSGERPAENLLSQKLRRLRREAQLTLQELSSRCGISASTLSKIEKSQLSPTYEKIAALAQGLGIQVGELFNDDTPAVPTGRRSVTRRGEGVKHETRQYDYEVLCAELAHKQFVPLLTTIKARSIKAFPALLRHEGEEFIYVLHGSLTVHTDFYHPMELAEGDSCYFDSTMGHACVAGDEDTQILWVCSNVSLLHAGRMGNGFASPAGALDAGKEGRGRK